MNTGDKLTDLLRERLAHHEMDVPAGAWEQISGQLAGAGEHALRETMQRKFSGHEVQVDPSAWTNIGSRMGHAGVAGGTVSTGWIAAGVAAVAGIAVALVVFNRETPPSSAPAPAKTVVAITVSPETTPAEALVEEPTPSATAAGTFEEPARPAAAPKAARPYAPQEASPSGDVPEAEEAGVQQAVTTPRPAAPGNSTTVIRPEAPASETKADIPATVGKEPAMEVAASKDPGTAQPANPGPEAPNGTANTQEQAPAADPFAHAEESPIFIPNVFSPQGDGVNDRLKIVAEGNERAEVRIFSAKTGELVFHTNNLAIHWDGSLPNGNIAEEGYYRCVVQISGPDGRPRVKTEVVRLYR